MAVTVIRRIKFIFQRKGSLCRAVFSVRQAEPLRSSSRFLRKNTKQFFPQTLMNHIYRSALNF